MENNVETSTYDCTNDDEGIAVDHDFALLDIDPQATVIGNLKIKKWHIPPILKGSSLNPLNGIDRRPLNVFQTTVMQLAFKASESLSLSFFLRLLNLGNITIIYIKAISNYNIK